MRSILIALVSIFPFINALADTEPNDTWPDANALGLNAFDASIAINTSTRPYFRAFSAGGVDQSGVTILVDPDLESEATFALLMQLFSLQSGNVSSEGPVLTLPVSR